MATRHSVATQLVLLAAACHLALGAERPEACPAADPGDGTPWWGQKCGPATCGTMYDLAPEKPEFFCEAIESACGDACGSPCCRPAPASPPSPPLSPPPLPPRPPAAPPSPCGNISLALHPSNGRLDGPSGATASCRALSDAMTGPSALISNDTWRELEFCAGCADADGCVRFCDCLIGKTARSDCAMYATHVTLPLRTRRDPTSPNPDPDPSPSPTPDPDPDPDPKQVRTLPCKHRFHQSCIDLS